MLSILVPFSSFAAFSASFSLKYTMVARSYGKISSYLRPVHPIPIDLACFHLPILAGQFLELLVGDAVMQVRDLNNAAAVLSGSAAPLVQVVFPILIQLQFYPKALHCASPPIYSRGAVDRICRDPSRPPCLSPYL